MSTSPTRRYVVNLTRAADKSLDKIDLRDAKRVGWAIDA